MRLVGCVPQIFKKGHQFVSDFKRTAIESDETYHNYIGNRIPWYVRLIWIGFWVFAIVYTIRFLFPAIQTELFQN